LNKKKIKENVDYFKSTVRYYQEWFGLINWELFIEESEDKSGDFLASCSWGSIGKVSTIFYNKKFIEDPKTTKKLIKRAAFHECAELFLGPIYSDIDFTFGHNRAQQRVHNVISMLENKILGVEPK